MACIPKGERRKSVHAMARKNGGGHHDKHLTDHLIPIDTNCLNDSQTSSHPIPGRVKKQICFQWNLCQPARFTPCPIMDARQPVDTMKKILLATVATLAFAAPSFA